MSRNVGLEQLSTKGDLVSFSVNLFLLSYKSPYIIQGRVGIRELRRRSSNNMNNNKKNQNTRSGSSNHTVRNLSQMILWISR